MRRTALLLLLVLAVGCRDDVDGITALEGDPIVASLVADAEAVFVGETILFDAGDSLDSSGTAARFSDTMLTGIVFDFGDGTIDDSGNFYTSRAWEQAGQYTVSVTVNEGNETASADVTVSVRNQPPQVLDVDVSADQVAVIGEWIAVLGRGFREDNTPFVSFEGVDALEVEFVDEFTFLVQVPVTTPSGLADLVIDFPDEDEGDAVFEIDVLRYGLATDAWRGRTYVIEFGAGDEATPISQSLELDEASVVAMSGDGSFALIGDARYAVNLEPSVVVVDMTADFQPVVTADLPNVGDGPLHGIAIADEAPIAVVTDLGGFQILDLSDPANPVFVGDRVEFQFGDLAPTAIALNPDGTKLALLSTFNDRVRFYEISPTGVAYSQDWVAVGPGAQDMVVHPETGYLYVLGGGGEGAIPPDFDLGNTTLAIIDWEGFEPENVHGPGIYLPTGACPFPIDMAVGPSGTAYVTTFDTNAGDIISAFGAIGNNPGNIGAWVDLVEGVTNLSAGALQPLDGGLDGTLTEREPLFAPFGFQGGVDVRYDERVFVSTVVGLGTTLEFFNGDDILYLSLDLDYGVAIGNLVTGNVQVHPIFSESIVAYDDFVLSYDLGPVTDLLLPPWSLGDVAIQP